MKDTAKRYLDAGLSVLSADRTRKCPTVGQWRSYQKRLPTLAELDAWFANGPDALCVVCGQVSGNLEMIDFDRGGELFDAWAAGIPAEFLDRLVIESTQSGGWHVVYQCESPVSGNCKLAERVTEDGEVVTLIETRGQGGLFLCAPTDGYELLQGDLARPTVLTAAERDHLLQTAADLNEMCDSPSHTSHNGDCRSDNANNADSVADNSHNGHGRSDNSHIAASRPESSHRPGDDFNSRGDIRPLMEKHGWAYLRKDDINEFWRRPGKTAGQSATLRLEDQTFYVFSANASPFEMNTGHSPFQVYTLLEHSGDFSAATRALSGLGYGQSDSADTGVDISGIVGMSADNHQSRPDILHSGHCPTDNAENGPDVPDIADPGPIPEHMFDIPGLVRQVMDFSLANAPYPNVGLAFCGGTALQSYLCGRKVRTPGDLRPNIYLLALASSGTGKDFPRKVNSRILFEIGHVAALGDKFASGQGIQDALLRSPAMLFQNDEMDGVLRQINFDRENKLESIPNILLTVFTAASDIYPIRVRAGQKEALHIDQPHLTLFGTATPQYFYESLSHRMLTNGLFARMMIVDIGTRGQGQTPGSARDVPEPIIEIARWWAEFMPAQHRGNMINLHPEPMVVSFTPQAAEAINALQRQTDANWHDADGRKDEVARTIWSRTCENAKKLALIYACSENHEAPVISLAAVEWASAFALHQTQRQLFMAHSYVAENPFHGECLKLMRKLREAPGQRMKRRSLMRTMRCKANDFDQLVLTLREQGEIEFVTIPGKSKSIPGYQAL